MSLQQSSIIDDGFNDFYGSTTKVLAQTFTTDTAYSLAYVVLKLYRINSPGNMTISIRATDSNGDPTGSDLVSATVVGNALTTSTAGEDIVVRFSSALSLSASTKYAILCTAPSGSAGHKGAWRMETTGTYSGGNGVVFSGGVWTANANDHYFKAYDTDGIQIFEHYNTNDNNVDTISSSSIYRGQTFTPLVGFTITSLRLKVYRVGSPGNVTIGIQGTSGNLPDNTYLCSETYDFDGVTTNTNGEWIEIAFSSPQALTAGTVYAIVAQCSSADGSNEALFRMRLNQGTYTSGNRVYSNNSGSTWAADVLADWQFETYGYSNSFLWLRFLLDYMPAITPHLASLKGDTFTPTRLIATDSDQTLVSVSDISDWIAGTTNQITVTDDADGTITLATPQDIDTGADVTFADLTLSAPVNIYALSHDSFADFVADEHVAHSGISITAGTGLSGGGTIDGNVSLAVDFSELTGESPEFAGLTLTGLSGILWANAGVVTGDARLDQLANPNTDKTFTMGASVVTWNFTNPVGGMAWNWTGGASGHLFTLSQNTGNVAAGTHLLHIDAIDPDVHLAHLEHADASYMALQVDVSGDTEGIGRFNILADGTLQWGNGTDAIDTNLYRSAADSLKTDDTFIANDISITTPSLIYNLSHDSFADFSADEHFTQANITTVGTIATGVWNGTTIAIANGGTGQTTQQAAIDALTNVSAATNEHVLTKDTGTGNAIWKAASGSDNYTVKIDAAATAGYIGAASNDGVLRVTTTNGLTYTDGGDFITLAFDADYTDISGNDAATDVTGAELEELTDGSTTTLHNHSGSGYIGYIKLSDVKAQNTNGGTFTQDAWQTRTLNTEDTDTGGDCTLSSNQITLAAGTYECHIICPGFNVDRHQARLYNTTGGSLVLLGTSEANAAAHSYTTHSTIVGRFTIAASQALEVQHYCTVTKATSGFGVACNITSEIYTVAEFWRVS